MCFPTKEQPEAELAPLFLEDGSVNTEENNTFIPEGLNEHIDSVYLNFNVEDGILAFVYECGNEMIIVYTSAEAEEYCEETEGMIIEECDKPCDNPFCELHN